MTRMTGIYGKRLAMLALLLTAVASGRASAQQPTQAQTNAIRQSCRTDYQAQCSDVPTGGRASLTCLQQHAASLSPACRSAVAAVNVSGAQPAPAGAASSAPGRSPSPGAQNEAGLIRASCRMDYRSLCHGVRPGGGRALSCLAANENSLSPGCRQALGALRQGR